jgi:hypothetical protein
MKKVFFSLIIVVTSIPVFAQSAAKLVVTSEDFRISTEQPVIMTQDSIPMVYGLACIAEDWGATRPFLVGIHTAKEINSLAKNLPYEKQLIFDVVEIGGRLTLVSYGTQAKAFPTVAFGYSEGRQICPPQEITVTSRIPKGLIYKKRSTKKH